MCGCLPRTPHQGPRHMPWPGIKPVTPWFVGWHSIHWATPARPMLDFSFSTYMNFIVMQVVSISPCLSFAFYFAYVFIFYCHVFKKLSCHLLNCSPHHSHPSPLLTSTVTVKWILFKYWVLEKAGKVHFPGELWWPSRENLFVTKFSRSKKKHTCSWICGRELWRIQAAGIIWVTERAVAWCQKFWYE